MDDEKCLEMPVYRCLEDGSRYFLSRNPFSGDYEIHHRKAGIGYGIVYISPDYSKTREKIDAMCMARRLD